MRGALYLVWGDAAEEALRRSTASLSAAMPDLAYHVERLPQGSNLLQKAGMFDLSPFEETVFLDADTIVLGRLDFGFEQAALHGIACSICECPWARRYPSIQGDVVEYNTGVLFFCKNYFRHGHYVTHEIFEAWKERAAIMDSSITWGEPPRRMALNDQASFAMACQDSAFQPFVLPRNWNFRPEFHREWFGPLKVWHSYFGAPDTVLRSNPEALPMDYNLCDGVKRKNVGVKNPGE
jgi:hypothetical protein